MALAPSAPLARVSASALTRVPAAGQWTDRLAYDVALALEGNLPDLSPIIHRHGLASQEFTVLLSDPVFLKTVLALREEIAARGVVFQTRARSLAEDVLLTTHELSRDPDVSPAVRHDCAKSIVRWSGWDKPEDTSGGASQGGVSISINIGGSHDNRTLKLGAAKPDGD